MKTRIIITLTALLMLAGISSNAQNGNLNPSTSSIIGDLNGDNKVNAADVVILIDHIQNMSNEEKVTWMAGSLFAKEDINLDGDVNSADVNALVSQIMTKVEFAAVDLRSDVDYADALLLSSNGYYILYDEDNNHGYTVLHLNEVSKDISDGITFFIDEEGNPVMATMRGGNLLFRNVTDNNFDFTFIDNQNNVYDFENIYYDDPVINDNIALTRGKFTPYENLFTGEWDKHSVRKLLPFAKKMAGFLVVAGTFAAALSSTPLTITVAAIALAAVIISEAIKSFSEDYENISTYLDGASTILGGWKAIDKLLLSLSGGLVGYEGDSQLKINDLKQYVDPVTNGEEWQIKLSTNSMEFGPNEDVKDVEVDSKAKWKIDDPELDDSWCYVHEPFNGKVSIHVKNNNSVNDRSCQLRFYAAVTDKIKSVYLNIKQTGYKFELSPQEVFLYQTHLSEEVNVETKNVDTWVISGSTVHDWCTTDNINREKGSFTITAKENPLNEERTGSITVTALLGDNRTVEKSINVRQEGSKYRLSPTEIVFTPTHRSEKIYPNSYPVTYEISCPENWCKVSPSSGALSITVDESLYEERECEIKVTASFEYGKAKIERTIKVKQLPLCPDTNHPHMIDLGLPSGTKWSCCNAGASSPEKMGNYYSWGNHSPLSDNFDKDYPYKEWRDINHNGIHDTQTWEETFIKLDEAYSSATSGSWGNGSMPSRDDYKELMENCEKTQYSTLGNQYGYYYTSKVNNNCIFIPYTYELEYWIYSTENNWAWYFNPSHGLPTNGLPGGSLGDPEIISGNDKAKYCDGRAVRPVSK